MSNVDVSFFNLKKWKIPFEDEQFDAVIACETFEHLNFNPLPVLCDVNRVIKKGGYLYVAMPNQSSWQRRVQQLRGKSVHNPVSDFVAQLNKNAGMLNSLHWREYTMGETKEMLNYCGFEISRAYYINLSSDMLIGANFIKTGINRLMVFLFDVLKTNIVVIGKKNVYPQHDFYITDANQ
jgi:ubiquinone/menaquinone biosynthesis C-methylase UbiE